LDLGPNAADGNMAINVQICCGVAEDERIATVTPVIESFAFKTTWYGTTGSSNPSIDRPCAFSVPCVARSTETLSLAAEVVSRLGEFTHRSHDRLAGVLSTRTSNRIECA
jgi:hypothetical protein